MPAEERPAGSWVLRNEFSAVELTIDHDANSARLRITDMRSGRSGYLDPLELERLSAARHADLAWIVSPANGETVDGHHQS
ncbi:MAG TPA: hypothetical protein VIQ30_05060 [Pseudonocardia sp.]|jgi:hypothetical protein